MERILLDNTRASMIQQENVRTSFLNHPAYGDGNVSMNNDMLSNPVSQLRNRLPDTYVNLPYEADAHQIGYRFVVDRNIPTENPASVFKNNTPPAEILNNIANPAPFPKIFGM